MATAVKCSGGCLQQLLGGLGFTCGFKRELFAVLGEAYAAARRLPPRKPLDLDAKTKDELIAMCSLLCLAEADLRLPL